MVFTVLVCKILPQNTQIVHTNMNMNMLDENGHNIVNEQFSKFHYL